MQAGDAHQLQRQRLRQPARRREADAQTGERARADADRDPVELIESQPRTREQAVHLPEQARRVARTFAGARVVAGLESAAVREPQGDRGGGRCRVEAEHDHASLRTSMRRRSAPRWASLTCTRARASSGAAASGHSTNAIRAGPR